MGANKENLKSMCPAMKAVTDQLEQAFKLINELKTVHNAHCADATAHASADVTNVSKLPSVTALT